MRRKKVLSDTPCNRGEYASRHAVFQRRETGKFCDSSAAMASVRSVEPGATRKRRPEISSTALSTGRAATEVQKTSVDADRSTHAAIHEDELRLAPAATVAASRTACVRLRPAPPTPPLPSLFLRSAGGSTMARASTDRARRVSQESPLLGATKEGASTSLTSGPILFCHCCTSLSVIGHGHGTVSSKTSSVDAAATKEGGVAETTRNSESRPRATRGATT
mmetsp:Transcript_4595/g.12822  ORF Transcript_4595/g.12822 Transcript_4595/m.12822 type:complete len:221 (+) Transcript_4595:1185-1847(+)